MPKPDFSCPKFDPDKGENLFFDVECKLLGNPTSKSWILNRNYVTNGIARFDNNHEYGKEVSDGMMIGYIISMKPTEIFDQVNGYWNSPCDRLIFGFKGKVSSTSSRFKRKTVKPEDFRLIHLWVDLVKRKTKGSSPFLIVINSNDVDGNDGRPIKRGLYSEIQQSPRCDDQLRWLAFSRARLQVHYH